MARKMKTMDGNHAAAHLPDQQMLRLHNIPRYPLSPPINTLQIFTIYILQRLYAIYATGQTGIPASRIQYNTTRNLLRYTVKG